MPESFKQKMRLLVEGVGSTPSWTGEAAEKAWVYEIRIVVVRANPRMCAKPNFTKVTKNVPPLVVRSFMCKF